MTAEKLRTLAILVAPLAFAAGLAHLGFQFWKHWDIVTLDFRFFWLAGDFWAKGESPYNADYAEEAAAQFEIMRGAIWYYTPNWFPLAAIFSLADPLTASRLWLAANAALLLASAALNVAAFRSLRAASSLADFTSPMTAFLSALPPRTLFFLFAGAMALSQAAGNTLHLGQSSMLIYFGGSLLMFGAVRGRMISGAAGLAILMLKPQIGILICAGLVFSAYGRRAIALAALASIAMAAPAFIVSPPAQLVADFARGVGLYTDQLYNMPPAVTGFRHLVWIGGGVDMGSPLYLMLALALACAFGLCGAMRRAPLAAADLLAASIAIAIMASPLHVYDFTLLGAIALYAAALPAPASAVAVSAFALLWRAGNLPHPGIPDSAAVTYYPGSAFASLAAMMIAGAIAYSLREAGPPGSSASRVRMRA